MADKKQPATEATEATTGEAARPAVQLTTSRAASGYVNFFRVTGSAEEVIADFGLNPQPNAPPNEPIEVTHRMAMSYFTAKRLLQVLHLTIQQHEANFGPIEIDLRKRLVRNPGS